MTQEKTFKKSCRRGLHVALLATGLGAALPAQALVFSLTSTGNAQADAGFQAAAGFWQNIFADPVTINIRAGFSALGTGILGQAGSSFSATTFSAVKGALGADATSGDDATMVAGLPAGTTYTKYINGTNQNSGAAHLGAPATRMQLTTANAKAIGLKAANAPEVDAEITFSSLFSFDFDPSDGIGAGLFDFVGIAIHELGHAMGFVSGVDVLDFNSHGRGPFNDNQFDGFTSLLDFTRCSAASEAAGADMDWRIGTDSKDFAIDGQCTALVGNAWSTGVVFGDGRQASHWKDNLGIGILDPTAVAPGLLNLVTARDIQALDVIGWTLLSRQSVPEPASLLLCGVALAGIAATRRKRPA